MFRLIFVFVVAFIALPLQAAPKEAPTLNYRLGVFPYMAPRQIVELYGPIAASMETVLKHPVRLESAATFPDFGRKLEERSYDIALIQPFDYHNAIDKLGYLPLAQLDAPLVTQLIVRDDSRYQKIEDLRGTTIGLPPEQSANARMTLRALHDNKLIPGRDIEVRYYKSHDSCLQQVWIGAASACGTSRSPILVFEQRMQAKLRPIYDTPPIPHVLFVIHPRIPAEIRVKLQQLITGWSQTENGRAMMKTVGFPGFVVPKPSDYAMMRNYDPLVAITKAEHTASKELVLGVFPYIAARKLAENFALALPAMSKSTGKAILFRSAPSYDNFSDALTSASYDIVLVQPFDYARAIDHGYLPLAGMKNQLQGTFFVLENSPYKLVTDFRGKVIATPPADSAQSRLARHTLLQAGLTPGHDVTINYSKNHEACMQLLQNDEVAACFTAELALSMLPNELTRGLRSIGLSEKVPGVLFMAHKRLPAKTRGQLQAEILSWSNSADGRKILQLMHFGDFITVKPEDYKNIPKFD